MPNRLGMFIRFVVLAIFVIIASLGVSLKLKKTNAPQVTNEDFEEVKRPKKQLKKVNRRPASKGQVAPLKEAPTFVNKARQDDRFLDREAIEAPTEDPEELTSVGPYQDTPPEAKRDLPTKATPPKSGRPSENVPQQFITSTPLPQNNPLPQEDPRNSSDSDTPRNSSGGGAGIPENISCSADMGSGSYSYAFNVTLTCTAASAIKYCLAENTCCDPETSGNSYTGPLFINPGAGTYCLSFVGTSTSGTVSNIVDKSYTLNPALPDLLVSHVKRYYQSTELDGDMSITSLDFGVAGMYAGVINLKDNDPGLAGLNWTCEEILNDHSTLGSNYVMADTDVAGFSASSQFDIFLTTTTLSYGNNFLTSYVQNALYVEPVLSCATNNIVLEDFEYFDPTPYQGVPGTNDVREFSGGFTHMGFFEPAATVYRGPAGSGSETVSAQELDSNLYGIFY